MSKPEACNVTESLNIIRLNVAAIRAGLLQPDRVCDSLWLGRKVHIIEQETGRLAAWLNCL